MNCKQAKRARGIAHKEAEKQGLLKNVEKIVYAKWWRKLLAIFFPKLRKKYLWWVGMLYKFTLKRWARQAYRSIHDQDLQAFNRARAKIKRKELRERMARREAANG